jgi:hypothetical protein
MKRSRLALVPALLLPPIALAVAYRRWLGPKQRQWGATPEEAAEALPGDEFVPDPEGQATRAITVDARPEHIWPWLVQMGHGRGGLYSWDWLDSLFGILDEPSATQVLPQFQALEAGDHIPLKNGPPFPVLRVDPERVLVLGSDDPAFQVTWQTVLRPIDQQRTRLITRTRARLPDRGARLFAAWIDLASFIMLQRWLTVLKERAEGLKAGRYRVAPDAAGSTGEHEQRPGDAQGRPGQYGG